MKKMVVIVWLCCMVAGWLGFAVAEDFVWEDIGRGNLEVRTVLVHPDYPQVIYLAGDKGVLKTEDAGETWQGFLSIKGQNKIINYLAFDPQDKNALYAASGEGLFYSPDAGKTWRRIFRGKSYTERDCTAVAILPYGIYVGTKAGLFSSQDKGRSWHKEPAKLGSSYILNIAYDIREPNYVYAACVDGVFRTKESAKLWERVFVANPAENAGETEEETEDKDEAERFSEIRYIGIDPRNLNYLYLATSRGVYQSKDRGESWQLLPDYGLLNKEVRSLLVAKESVVYAATKSGIFEYKNERWQEISLGLLVNDIRFLAVDNQDNLYAAGDKGLFRTRLTYSGSGKTSGIIGIYYQDEPAISAVQQAAIKYAEVEPEKIMQWRKQAQKKAWLPSVSMGIDRNTTDLWHWEGGSTTKVDDDTLRRGRDSVEWDLTFTWDLGELIWNDDQTSIDVRSRLLVQLRDDVLDEVTKLYFERLRVKMELDNLSIEDRKKRFEKELRLQEITAYLDGLTGGYFSKSKTGP